MNQSRRTGLLRLRHLKEVTEAKAEEMDEMRERFDAMRNAEPTKAISSFNLFQSPVEVAAIVADKFQSLVGISSGKRFCEPSAGLGRLVDAVGRDCDWVVVDVSNECCEHLYGIGLHPINEDFLACDADRLGGLFDGIIMNPPFKLGTDIKHICHAMSLVKPGCPVVSLCYNGTKQNKRLKPLVDTWQVLPEGSFRSEGTNASVAMVTWRRP